MATVPTAIELGLGQKSAVADNTPLQNLDSGAIGAIGKNQATQQIDLGQSLVSTAQNVQGALTKVKSREDTIDRARKMTKFNEEAQVILQTARDTTDLSIKDNMALLQNNLQVKQDEILGSHGGSADSTTSLTTKLEIARAGFASTGAAEGIARQKAIVGKVLKDRNIEITAKALQDPGKIQEYFAEWDASVKDMADGLDPDEEIAHIEAGRSSIVLSSIEAFTSRADYAAAKKLIDENPFVMKQLNPDQQRKVVTEISTGLTAQFKMNNAGNIKVQTAEQILQRKLSPKERIDLAGLTSSGPKTWTEKISDIEKVVGPLSPTEKKIAIGLESKASGSDGKPQSKIGKEIFDESLIIDKFGDGSKQHKAFVEARDSEGDAKVSDVAGMRKEFTKLSGDYMKLRDAHGKIVVSAKNSSPAGDLALIFNYMKMLDPGSTVREGEFATAEQSGNISKRVVSTYNKLITNEGRLDPGIRADFLSRAGMIMGVQQRTQTALEQQFTALANSAGFNSEDVVIDFSGTPLNLEDDHPETNDEKPAIDIDLTGKPIVSEPKAEDAVPAAAIPSETSAPADYSKMTAVELGNIDVLTLDDKGKQSLSEALKAKGF